MASLSRMVVQFVADTTNMHAGMAGLEARLNTFQTNAQKNASYATGGFAAIGGALQNIGGMASSAGSALTQYVTLPLVGVGAAAMKTAIDFETAFAGVRKTVDEDANTHFPALKESILETARATGIAATEIAGIMQVAGQLGIRGNGALTSFTQNVADLTIATDLSAESIAMMLGKFINISGLDAGKDMDRVADIIAHLGNNSATTEDAIMKFGVRIAGIGRISNMTAEEVFALAAAAEASGTKAERGGTAFTKIFMQMQTEATSVGDATNKFTKAVQENDASLREWKDKLAAAKDEQARLGASATTEDMQRLSETIESANENIAHYTENGALLREELGAIGTESGSFAKVLGITDDKFKEIYNSSGGAIEIFQMLTKVIADAQKEGKSIGEIFDTLDLKDSRLMQSVISLSLANDDAANSMSSLYQTLANSKDAMGALDAEVLKRLDTVSGQWGILKEIIKSFAIIFTDDSNGVLKEYLKSLNDGLRGLLEKLKAMKPEEIKNMVDWFIRLAALGPALKLIGDAMTVMGGATKGIGGMVARFQLPSMDKGALNAAIAGAGFSNVPEELARVQGTWAVKLGKAFNESWLTNAFSTKDGSIADRMSKSIGQPIQGFIDNNLKTRTESPIMEAFTTSRNPKSKKWAQGGGVDPGSTIGTALRQVGTSVTTDATTASLAAESLVGGFGKLAALVPNLMMLLGGLAAVIAVVALGFTAFAVISGESVGSVRAKFIEAEVAITMFFTNLGTKIADLRTKFPEFAANFSTMFGAVVTGIGTFLISLIEGLGSVLPSFILFAGDIISSLIQGFVDHLPNLLEQAVGILMALAEGFLDALPAMITVGFQVISSLIAGLIKALPMLWQAAWGLIFSLANLLVEKIMDGTLGDILAAIGKGLLDGLATIGKAVWEAVMSFFASIVDGIKKFFGIKSPSKLMNDIGEFIMEGLMNGIKAYFELLKLFWITIPKFLLDQFLGALTWLYNIGKDILAGLWNGIKWYYTTLFKTYFNVGKWILDAFIGSGTWLLEVGKNIMQGLKSGIFEIGDQMGRWVSELGSNFVNGVKNFFGVKSPSRVMMKIGNYIGEGLAIGIDDSTSDILASARAMEEAAMIDPAILSGDRNIDGTIKHNYDGLTEAFIQALEMVGLNVYLDGDEVTDKIQKRLVLAQRRGR